MTHLRRGTSAIDSALDRDARRKPHRRRGRAGRTGWRDRLPPRRRPSPTRARHSNARAAVFRRLRRSPALGDRRGLIAHGRALARSRSPIVTRYSADFVRRCQWRLPKITLRHLLTHTAGLSTTSCSPGARITARASRMAGRARIFMEENLARIARAGLAYPARSSAGPIRGHRCARCGDAVVGART